MSRRFFEELNREREYAASRSRQPAQRGPPAPCAIWTPALTRARRQDIIVFNIQLAAGPPTRRIPRHWKPWPPWAFDTGAPAYAV
jgi:hypothetical protein